MFKFSKTNLLAATAMAALLATGGAALAGDKVSGDVGISYN
jgi:hypothetical protein